jgi:hypothetical protein
MARVTRGAEDARSAASEQAGARDEGRQCLVGHDEDPAFLEDLVGPVVRLNDPVEADPLSSKPMACGPSLGGSKVKTWGRLRPLGSGILLTRDCGSSLTHRNLGKLIVGCSRRLPPVALLTCAS